MFWLREELCWAFYRGYMLVLSVAVSIECHLEWSEAEFLLIYWGLEFVKKERRGDDI